jgi:3-hydroxyisobutyrate dehydrogenase
VAGADLVVTMLLDADAVEEAMAGGGALEAMRDDAVWVQMSTVGLDGVERLSKLAEERGVAYVDAPVLGTKQPAEQAQLIVLAGGPDDAKERAQPVFEAVGAKTVDLGEAGAAMRAKLMLNHWVLALVEATAETIALAEALGLDPQLFLDTIEGGPLDSKYAQMKGAAVIAREMPPAFPLSGALKDVGLILEAAERHDFDAALAATVQRKMQQAVDAGHGDEDMAATYYASHGE